MFWNNYESVLFSFIIRKNHLYACLILADQCDGTTPPPQGHPRVDPACATRMPGLASLSVPAHLLSQGSLVSRNRYSSSLPELKWRVGWTWARAGRAAGPHGGQNKALRGPWECTQLFSHPSLFFQWQPGFSSLLFLPDAVLVIFLYSPVFFCLPEHTVKMTMPAPNCMLS